MVPKAGPEEGEGAEGTGPIVSEQEAKRARALLAAAEKEFPDESNRNAVAASLIAALRSKLRVWDEGRG